MHVDAKNAGQSTIFIGGIAVNVYGIRFNDRIRTRTITSSTDDLFNRTLLPERPTLLYSTGASMQPFGNPNSFVNLQPGTSYAGSFAFVIPPHKLDSVRIQWQICFSKLANKTWHMPLNRRPDGSNWFNDKYNQANAGTGLICYDDPGAYYPL